MPPLCFGDEYAQKNDGVFRGLAICVYSFFRGSGKFLFFIFAHNHDGVLVDLGDAIRRARVFTAKFFRHFIR